MYFTDLFVSNFQGIIERIPLSKIVNHGECKGDVLEMEMMTLDSNKNKVKPGISGGDSTGPSCGGSGHYWSPT